MKSNLIAILSICFLLLCSFFSHADLEILSSTLKSGDYQDVYVVEEQNLAYFVNGRGLEIYNLENPASPTLVGEKDTSGFASGVFVSGDYAYVSDYWDGLAIIDVTDPENPQDPIYVPGYIDETSAPAQDVFVIEWPMGKWYAYVANGWDGLVIVDVSEPESPVFVASIETGGGDALGVFVREGPEGPEPTLYAYVADLAGLAIVNVTDPENPELTEFVETEGIAKDVFIGETSLVSSDIRVFAHVAAGLSGLAMIEVTEPEIPGDPVYIPTPGDASGVYVRERIAYMANGLAGLVIVKEDRPIITPIPTDGYAENVFVNGDYAYVANNGNGIAIVELSPPDYPLETIKTPGYPLEVFVDRASSGNNYAYVAAADDGLAIVDVEDPRNPGEPPIWAPWGPDVGVAEGVFVSRSEFNGENYAYIATYAQGLAIFNVEDPTNPEHVYQEQRVPGPTLGIFVNGNYAYVAYGEDMSGSGGLAILDVTDPEHPGDIEIVEVPGTAEGVFVSEGPDDKLYAYVAYGWESITTDGWVVSGSGGLAIVDVEALEIISGVVIPGYANNVYVSEDYAYVANDDGLDVIDVSNPEFPDHVTRIDTGPAFDVHAIGNYAYVANYDKGLAVVNISKPDYPIEEQIDTSGWAYGVFAESASEDAIVYVADLYSLTIIGHTVICIPPIGDVSGNCVISAYDAALILRHVASIITLDDEQRARADVSANGRISALDAAMVLQYTVGLIIEFPAAPALSPKGEQKLLASAISELERIPLSQEQLRVLEQLKNLSQSLPTRTTLLQNYPNPFNPETWIPYQLKDDSNVTIRIMDIQGRLVRQIDLGNKPAGVYVSRDSAAYWDGRNSLGEKVSSGVYFYTLQAEHPTQSSVTNSGKFTFTKKMVIMK